MRGRWFVIIAVVLAAVDILIPFLVLRENASFLGSYLFWSLLTLSVIVFGIVYTLGWGKDS